MNVQFQQLLFVMPDDGEAYLAALAAICTYTSKLSVAGIKLNVVLVAAENWLTELVTPPSFRIVTSVEQAGTGYDVVLDLTLERARQLAHATGLTCASAFGTLLGFEQVRELPPIRVLPEPEYDVGVVEWGASSTQFCLAAKRIDENVQVRMVSLQCMKPRSAGYSSLDWWWSGGIRWDWAFETISKCGLIVSMRSPLTYLAACAGRAVIELYPEDEYERTFFDKPSAARYWMMPLATRQAIDEGTNYLTLWRSFERIWQRIAHRRTMMVQQ